MQNLTVGGMEGRNIDAHENDITLPYTMRRSRKTGQLSAPSSTMIYLGMYLQIFFS